MLTRTRYAVLACLLLVVPVTYGQSELVIYREGTGLYHRAGCPTLKDAADVMAMTRAQAESRGHKAHADCDPAVMKKPDGAPAPGAPPAPVTVYLIDGKYYHRKDCPRLKGREKVKSESLETAGKSHWPCPDCRPPVRRKSAEPAVPGTGRRG